MSFETKQYINTKNTPIYKALSQDNILSILNRENYIRGMSSSEKTIMEQQV